VQGHQVEEGEEEEGEEEEGQTAKIVAKYQKQKTAQDKLQQFRDKPSASRLPRTLFCCGGPQYGSFSEYCDTSVRHGVNIYCACPADRRPACNVPISSLILKVLVLENYWRKRKQWGGESSDRDFFVELARKFTQQVHDVFKLELVVSRVVAQELTDSILALTVPTLATDEIEPPFFLELGAFREAVNVVNQQRADDKKKNLKPTGVYADKPMLQRAMDEYAKSEGVFGTLDLEKSSPTSSTSSGAHAQNLDAQPKSVPRPVAGNTIETALGNIGKSLQQRSQTSDTQWRYVQLKDRKQELKDEIMEAVKEFNTERERLLRIQLEKIQHEMDKMLIIS